MLLSQFPHLRHFSFVAPASRDTMLQILNVQFQALEVSVYIDGSAQRDMMLQILNVQFQALEVCVYIDGSRTKRHNVTNLKCAISSIRGKHL